MRPGLPLVALFALAACAPPLPPGVGAGPSSSSAPFYMPGEATPTPPGVIGTPDPFLAAYPPTSTIVLPGELGQATTIRPTYIVAAIEPYEGATRLSCLARGTAGPKNDMMEFRFELLLDKPPPAPGSWPVSPGATLARGHARVTLFRGAGSPYEGKRGSLAIAKVDRQPQYTAYDFAVDAVLEPSSAGPGTPSASPTSRAVASAAPTAVPPGGPTAVPPGGPTAAPPATPAAAPTAPAAASTPGAASTPAAPGGAAPAAPLRGYPLAQVGTSVLVRWTGRIHARPEGKP